jgi:hypothetical protein
MYVSFHGWNLAQKKEEPQRCQKGCFHTDTVRTIPKSNIKIVERKKSPKDFNAVPS